MRSKGWLGLGANVAMILAVKFQLVIIMGDKFFYVFGRNPADLTQYADHSKGRRKYPLVDLVVCHGDFLNADHKYVQKIRA